MQKKLAEAALFMSATPLTLSELSNIIEATPQESSRVLEELMQQYKTRDTSLEIARSDDKYQMRVKNQFMDKVSHLAVSADMTKAVLRTLGLISMREPILQSDVVKIIGNKAYDYIKELRDRGFILAKKQGTTKKLSTTPKFEAYFGKKAVSIKNIV